MNSADTGAILDDIIAFVAYDTVNSLTDADRNALARELGSNWESQILTPLLQPMTLRSGKVLETGGSKKLAKFPSKLFKTQKGAGCPFGVNLIARIMFTTLLVYSLWTLLNHPITIEKGKEALQHINNFECVISRNTDLWKRRMCGTYNDFLNLLDDLYYNTIPTLRDLYSRYQDAVKVGSVPSVYVVYATVKSIVSQFNTITRRAIDVICNMMRSSIDYKSLSAEEKQMYQKGFIANGEDAMVRIKRIRAIAQYNGTAGKARSKRKS